MKRVHGIIAHGAESHLIGAAIQILRERAIADDIVIITGDQIVGNIATQIILDEITTKTVDADYRSEPKIRQRSSKDWEQRNKKQRRK